MCQNYVVKPEQKIRTPDGKVFVKIACTRGCPNHQHWVRVRH